MRLLVRINKTFPQIHHKITYFLFFSALLIHFISFLPGKYFLTGRDFYRSEGVKFLNSYGNDFFIGYWSYCIVEHNWEDPEKDWNLKTDCRSLDVMAKDGHFYFEKGDNNITTVYEIPFPGPCLQMARIWSISSLSLCIFGGCIIWILILSSKVRWMYAAYMWFIATVLQAFSVIIMTSVLGRLREDEPNIEVVGKYFETFEIGNDVILQITSICILLVSTCSAIVIVRFDIPRPYSAKREFLRKINELREKQKEQQENERKEKEKRQKEAKKNLKKIKKQQSIIRKSKATLKRKYSMNSKGSSKGRRKSVMSKQRRSFRKSVGRVTVGDSRKSRILKLNEQFQATARKKSIHQRKTIELKLAHTEGWDLENFNEDWSAVPEAESPTKTPALQTPRGPKTRSTMLEQKISQYKHEFFPEEFDVTAHFNETIAESIRFNDHNSGEELNVMEQSQHVRFAEV